MPDTKISGLPAATTPLAGTEVLPIVQGGVTEQVSVANLTAGRAVSAASLSLTTPLVVTSGGTGTGTAFTAGSIVFAGTSGVYTQDNGQLFWNDTTDKMSIGTNTTLRNARLSIKGLNETLTSGNGQLCLITSDAVGLDVGASLVLGGQSAPRADNPFATISGRSENNSYAGYFSINTGSVGGGMPERIRVNSSGFTQFVSNLVLPNQPAQTTKAAAATLTGAELITGILQYTGGAATVNFPTGTNIEGALLWAANNVALDFFVINTGAGTCTMGANGNTTVGTLTVAAATSAHFRVRRTAANTFTIYRLV